MEKENKDIQIIPAEKQNKAHKKQIWTIFNENVDSSLLTSKPVSYEDHCKWWEIVFEKEYIYIVLFKLEICGYIRLTKYSSEHRDKNEISIAISNKYQNLGIGSYAYKLFENKMKEIGIQEICAITLYNNNKGREFFEKNDFQKLYIKYVKKL